MHLVKDLLFLALDDHADLLSQLRKLIYHLPEILRRLIHIHDHHHVKKALHDGLGDVQNIDLADNQINILDISQTIVQGFFNMMMIVDMNQTTKDFGQVVDELAKLGEEIGVVIKCQKEEIFDQMHRI